MKTLNDLIEELYEQLSAQGMYYEMWEDHGDLVAEINWGDWKHDHLYFDYIARDFFTAHNIAIADIDTQVTEEDGSDCYSALHVIRLAGTIA